MSAWLSHLVLNALGLGFLGLLAWAAVWVWRREAGTTYRFLVLVLVLAVLIPGLQLLLHRPAPAQISGTAVPNPMTGQANRTVDIELRLVHLGAVAPPADALREPPGLGAPGDLPPAAAGSSGPTLPDESAPFVLV